MKRFIRNILLFFSFKYEIKSGNEDGNFGINEQTGAVHTIRALDREHISKYQLSIIAKDKNEICHKGLTILIVNIKDKNDNIPIFQRKYTSSVREDTPPNQYVIQVSSHWGR